MAAGDENTPAPAAMGTHGSESEADEYVPTAKLTDLLSLLKSIKEQNDAQSKDTATQSAQAAFSRQLPVAASPKPGVRSCNWETFKNRFSADEPQHSIETLVGGPDLSLQVVDESIRRGATSPPGAVLKELSSSMSRGPSQPQIYRVRIQSAAILDLLNTVSGDFWDVTKSHTFMRPFGYLIHHHENIKAELAHLEAQASAHEQPPPDTESTQPSTSPETVLEDIRAYVKFVDESLIPLNTQFDSTSDGSKTVRFDDLWYLFRPGDLVHSPGDLGTNPHELSVADRTWRGRDLFSSSGRQKLWRVCSVQPHSTRVRDALFYNDTTLKREGDSPESSTGVGACVVSCYYLDFDGTRVLPVWRKFGIAPFSGQREIRNLDVYPLRFVDGGAAPLLASLEAQGRRFLACVAERHMRYNGWIQLHEPDGSEAKDYNGESTKYSEQYVGQVYVDVKEALDDNPHWRFVHHPAKPHEVRSARAVEPYRVHRWEDAAAARASKDAAAPLSSHYEIVVHNDDVERFAFAAYLGRDRFIGASAAQLDALELRPEDVALLPRRIYAYLFRFRSFRLVDVHRLRAVQPDPDAFDRLQIDERNKKTIRSVVHSHFWRKQQRTAAAAAAAAAAEDEDDYGDGDEQEEEQQDLIRGKARGLVVLIQGAPGVGKTATAEAVAQANRRPLFTLNLEDIDYTAELLSRLFRRAEMWDCIMLLDEVDVFLGQRTPHDQRANMLVSFFLQVLENFSGILFLTTNRPGALDEAVKSRVQVNLCYRPLDLSQTIEIFRLNMERLARSEAHRATATSSSNNSKAGPATATATATATTTTPPLVILSDQILHFAEQHYRRNSAHDGLGRWNGRQIRNAFLIASGLAHYEVAAHGPGVQPQLRASHFDEVEALTLEYDRSRARTLGKSDAKLAHERSERFDGWLGEEGGGGGGGGRGRGGGERDMDRERGVSPSGAGAGAEYAAAQMGNNRRLSPMPGSSSGSMASSTPRGSTGGPGGDARGGGGGGGGGGAGAGPGPDSGDFGAGRRMESRRGTGAVWGAF